MRSLRLHVRSLAATWLLFQVVWVAALVPRNCCAAHQPEESCHESVAATECPMRGADGQACPMHRAQNKDQRTASHADHHGQPAAAFDHHHPAPPVSSDCKVGGTCDGPMAALLSLLSSTSILPDSSSSAPDAHIRPLAAAAAVNLVARIEPPDSPPPRA
jgi:hypothetical protein